MGYPFTVALLILVFNSGMWFDTFPEPGKQIAPQRPLHHRIMFYNVENLFDTRDNPNTDDDLFTPAGGMHWTYKRYTAKLTNICKVLVAAGGWQPPDIIGFCEVENDSVLIDLFENTLLSKYRYRVVHYNSPDHRGIDVALAYNRQLVECLYSRNIRVSSGDLLTRDILYIKALLGGDTCHFFINHWPSRSSGQLDTERYRFAAAGLLRQVTDSILLLNSAAKILIMGDFNDEPGDESLAVKLNAKVNREDPLLAGLYNLTGNKTAGEQVQGTLKYQGVWNVFDQIIVSSGMLNNTGGIYVKPDGFTILNDSFLLEPDVTYTGYKPFRTYSGFIYRGGFSDHLPVYVDVFVGKE
ncbi:MAG: endonuclease/exonuclease/phosphatase family protein [Bacteroidales bacterium]|nr:endonuclease/exonuclease/phosphatase family protein [Bacteroidales bacterium]